MGKQRPIARFTAMLLAVMLLFGMQVPVAGALSLGESSNFTPADFTPDFTLPESIPPESEEEETYSDDELVRVSIVLEDPPTLAVPYKLDGIAANSDAMTYREHLEQIQDIVVQNIETYALDGEELDVVWNLTLAANAISANVEYGKIDEIEAMEGVVDVFVETVYMPDVVETEGTVDANMAGSSSMTGSSLAYADGFTGAGSRIAIIDTGIDYDHISFDADAYEYSLHRLEEKGLIDIDDLDLMTEDTIEGVLDELNIAGPDVTAKKLYLTSKLPFAYNYFDHNYTIDHHSDAATEHGSHVAGIAAANAYIPSEESEGEFEDALEAVNVRGVAPDAQILTMKVFGKMGQCRESDYMVAIEDAIILGADTINLSLGSPNADFNRSSFYTDILENLIASGTVCVASAGNNGAWADYGRMNGYLLADDVNMYTGGSPGSYNSSFTVGSVDNYELPENYITVDGQRVYCNVPDSVADSLSTIAGKKEYVYLPGDALADTNTLNTLRDTVKGRVVVCQRGGEIPLSTMANNVATTDAVAVVIVNNETGTLDPDLSDYNYKKPVLTVTKSDGVFLKNAAEAVKGTDGNVQYYLGKLTVKEDVDSSEKSGYYTMSFFSAFGVLGNLVLKPDVVAPGGNIHSVDGSDRNGKAYETLSGTSMAGPQVTGMAAVLGQYIRDTKLTQTDYDTRFLTQNLLMSTSVPMKDEESRYYYPVLQQGSGHANIQRALNAQALIIMDKDATAQYADGKVKAEFGDDTDRKGSYSYSFTIKNFSGKENKYALSTELFTQDLLSDTLSNGVTTNLLDKKTTRMSADISYTVNNISVDPATAFTVGAYDEVTVSVKITLTEEEKKKLNASYKNGAYVEGYTFIKGIADYEGIKDVEYSIPFIGFYGNWSDATMYDRASYAARLYGDNALSYIFPHIGVGANIWDENYLSIVDSKTESTRIYTGNPYAIVPEIGYPTERGAIRSTDTIYGYTTTLIRNAAAGAIFLTKKDGTWIGMGNVRTQIIGSYCYRTSWQVNSRSITLNRTPAQMGLNDGDVFKVNSVAVPEYYETNGDISADELEELIKSNKLGNGAYMSTTLNIDDQKPQILDIKKETNGNLTVKVKDNQYLAYLCVSNRSGTVVYASYVPKAERGEEVTYTFDLQDADIGPTCLVFAGDYATNSDTVYFNYGGEYPKLEGKLGGYIHSGGGSYDKAWTVIDAEVTDTDKSQLRNMEPIAQHGGDTITAAAYVDEYIYHVIGSKLYVSPVNEIDNFTELVDLERFRLHSVYALSYNTKDNLLYALTSGNILWSINPLNGYAKRLAQITVSDLTGAAASITSMAIDGEGNFYGITYSDTGSSLFLQWNLNEIANEQLTITGKAFTSGTIRDRYGSMAYDLENNALYLASSYNDNTSYSGNRLFRINPITRAATQVTTEQGGEFRLNYSVRGLFYVPAQDDDTTLSPADKIRELNILPDTLNMFVTGQEDLEPLITPWTAKDKDITWSTTNSKVVTVENGMVTAVGTGTATVKATVASDPNVWDSCEITVEEIPDIQMSALIYDSNKTGHWVNYNVASPEKWESVYEELSYSFYSGGLSNGKLYANDGSMLYTIDPDTFQVTEGPYFTYTDYAWTDAAQRPKHTVLTYGNVVGITQTGTWIALYDTKTAHPVCSTMNFRSPAATIAYIGARDDGAGLVDHYYILLEDGSLYDVEFPTNPLKYEFLGVVSGINLKGVSQVTRKATASMWYDEETKYLVLTSRIKGDKAKVQLIDPKSLRVMSNTDFGEDVWPAVIQYQYDKEENQTDKTQIANEVASPEEFIAAITQEVETIPEPYSDVQYSYFFDPDKEPDQTVNNEKTTYADTEEKATDVDADEKATHSVYSGLENALELSSIDKNGVRPNASGTAVARVESTKAEYPTLQEAIDAAHDLITYGNNLPQTVTLLADTTESVRKVWTKGSVDYDYNLIIDLNGHTVKGTGNGPVMWFESGGRGGVTHSFNITINDSDPEKKGTITGGTGKAVTLSGTSGGGIYFSASTDHDSLTVNGGNIVNNTVTGNGGAIAMEGSAAAHLILNGGTISGNTAANGAVSGRWITVDGCEITDNIAVSQSDVSKSGSGGGIYMWGTGTQELEMGDGARIYGNMAETIGDDIVITSQRGSVDYDVRLSDPAKWVNEGESGIDSAWYADGADGLYDYNNNSDIKRYDPNDNQKLNSYTVTEKGNSAPAYSIAAKQVGYVPEDATVYTVTYKDGANGTVFKDKVYFGLKDGSNTPSFNVPARPGYRFLKWDPEWSKTVTENVTYTAQWEEISAENVELDQTELILNEGDSAVLNATVSPDTALHTTVKWSVEQANNVVTITSDRNKATLKAIGAGTATVTAEINGHKATCTVTVNHVWGKPEFDWQKTESGYSVTATRKCTLEHTQTKTVDATVKATTPSTCTKNGTTTYTATVSFDGEEFTETKDVSDIPLVDHTPQLRNAKIPTCSEEGHTGDTYCSVCEELLEQGKAIPKTDHTPELRDVKEATCSEEGYTGDTYCSVCEELLEQGEVIPKTEHHYENGKCIDCGDLQFILGDVDLDGEVTIKDATLIQLYCARLKTLTEEQLLRADVDQDRDVNVKDATQIQLYLARLISGFGNESM